MPLEEVSANELPLQKVVPGELIVGTAGVILVIATGDETATHPELFVTVTIKLPAIVVLIFCVVAPVDHK